jgi:ribosomal protein L14
MTTLRLSRNILTFHDPELVDSSDLFKDCSEDGFEVIEEDVPQSRISRIFGPVERLFRRRDPDPETETESYEVGSSYRNSDDVAEVIERSRRSRRRSGNSDDSVEVIEEDVPQSRVSRILGPVERLFRRRDPDPETETESYEVGSSNRNSDDVVEIIEEDSDVPRTNPVPPSRVSRIFGQFEGLFGRRDRDREAEMEPDQVGSSDREAGSASGSDMEGGVSRGLGAALPEPLRRLFVRRRRIHDVESVLEDD